MKGTLYLYHYVFDKYIGYATVGHATVELQQRGRPGLLFLRAECGCAFAPWGHGDPQLQYIWRDHHALSSGHNGLTGV